MKDMYALAQRGNRSEADDVKMEGTPGTLGHWDTLHSPLGTPALPSLPSRPSLPAAVGEAIVLGDRAKGTSSWGCPLHLIACSHVSCGHSHTHSP